MSVALIDNRPEPIEAERWCIEGVVPFPRAPKMRRLLRTRFMPSPGQSVDAAQRRPCGCVLGPHDSHAYICPSQLQPSGLAASHDPGRESFWTEDTAKEMARKWEALPRPQRHIVPYAQWLPLSTQGRDATRASGSPGPFVSNSGERGFASGPIGTRFDLPGIDDARRFAERWRADNRDLFFIGASARPRGSAHRDESHAQARRRGPTFTRAGYPIMPFSANDRMLIRQAFGGFAQSGESEMGFLSFQGRHLDRIDLRREPNYFADIEAFTESWVRNHGGWRDWRDAHTEPFERRPRPDGSHWTEEQWEWESAQDLLWRLWTVDDDAMRQELCDRTRHLSRSQYRNLCHFLGISKRRLRALREDVSDRQWQRRGEMLVRHGGRRPGSGGSRPRAGRRRDDDPSPIALAKRLQREARRRREGNGDAAA